MRIALIADIHANLRAFEAMLEALEHYQPYKLYSLGDVVGGGPRPSECVDLLYDKAWVALCGKTDLMVLGQRFSGTSTSSFARKIEWTRKRLSEQNRKMLGGLAELYYGEDMIFSHGSPNNPDAFDLVANDAMVRHLFDTRSEQFIFSGGTHVPRVTRFDIVKKTMTTVTEAGTYKIEPKSRYYINVGSVGDPKDGNPHACAIVVDSDDDLIALLRVPYDNRISVQKQTF